MTAVTQLERQDEELRRLVEEQTALRRVATLVASGVSEIDLVSVVTSEIARLFGAHTAKTLRWDGETIRVVGDWHAAEMGERSQTGRIYTFGGDTITARVVHSAAAARVDSPDALFRDFAKERQARDCGARDRERQPARSANSAATRRAAVRAGRGDPASQLQRSRGPIDRECEGRRGAARLARARRPRGG